MLDGESGNKGETIEYEKLMDYFKELKGWLKNKLEEELKVQTVQQGRKVRASKQEQEISFALQSLGDEGIALSAKFNAARAKQTVVTTLFKAMRDGNLLEKAKEVLISYESGKDNAESRVSNSEINLKRVCWCFLKKDL